MLLIDCPHCGPRAELEFSYGNEAHIARPKEPDSLSDAEWADYLFLRDNTKGVIEAMSGYLDSDCLIFLSSTVPPRPRAQIRRKPFLITFCICFPNPHPILNNA